MNMYQIAKYVLLTLTGMMIAAFVAYFFLVTFYPVPVIAPVPTSKTEVAVVEEPIPHATGTTEAIETATPSVPVSETDPSKTEGKLKAANFTGKLEVVDTGCFADGECFVMIDGRHVTALRGWSQETVGTVIGVSSFGDLEQQIGKTVEVYVQDLSDGTYTLYGSEGFYIKVLP